jgi:hypothetical protein
MRVKLIIAAGVMWDINAGNLATIKMCLRGAMGFDDLN